MVCGPHHTAAPLSHMRSAANKCRLRDHVRLPLPLEFNRPPLVSPHWSSAPRAQIVRGVEFESSTYVCALRLRHRSGSGRAFGDEYSQPGILSVWLRICSISIVRRLSRKFLRETLRADIRWYWSSSFTSKDTIECCGKNEVCEDRA
jgi:hypothetical protein